MSESRIRLLIADDHFIVREGLRLIFETTEDIDLVGEASDGADAVRLVMELSPHVVLMDLRMPGMDGLTAIKILREKNLTTPVIILTTYDEDDLMLNGLRAGAVGFLLKDTDRETLINAIKAAARGETLLTSDILARLVAHTSKSQRQPARPQQPSILDLTDRELEVLQAAAKGERSKEIARRLGITERTVKAHLTNIYNKLGVDSRAAAVAVAAQRGGLPDEVY
ncbi:MAG: response regulator transcription factor [Anaerolineales bacterium]|nr:MAG: response regulator transcription factor [Anaerolineales bacterium]